MFSFMFSFMALLCPLLEDRRAPGWRTGERPVVCRSEVMRAPGFDAPVDHAKDMALLRIAPRRAYNIAAAFELLEGATDASPV